MAEAVFQKRVDKAGLAEQIRVDSAGTGPWHVGEPAHSGTLRVLAEHDIVYHGRARQVSRRDMSPDNYVIGLDNSNVRDLERQFGKHARLYRLLDFAQETNERDVPDAYYTGNFERVYELIEDGTRGLLAAVRREQDL